MSGRLDAEATERAFVEGAVFRRLERDVVFVTGPGARDYLQSQCSQDLAHLGVGDSTWSLLLAVQGKVEALVRVGVLGDDAFALDTDCGQGEVVLERLRRFKIRVRAELELSRLPALELRGPLLPTSPSPATGLLVAAPLRAFGRAIDLVGATAEPPDGVAEGDDAAFEVARIEAGVPRMGTELDASVIPFEAGITDETVSFTKGCYTGQELVARLEARGANVPRHLRGIVVAGDVRAGAVQVGAELLVGEQVVGSLTSVACSELRGVTVGLGYVRRAVTPPQPARLVAASGDAFEVTVEALPLIR